MAVPQPRFYVNWEGRNGGFLISNTTPSTISNTTPQNMTHGWDPAFAGVYDEVTTDVKQASFKRGRGQMFGPMEAAEMTWTLKDVNADGSYRGRYNRNEPTSPLVTNNSLRPMRPAKIEWTDSTGTVWPIAYGWLRTATGDGSTSSKTATFDFIDIFEWLDNQYPVIEPTGPITTGQAFKTLLAACGWDNPALLDIDDGDDLSNFFVNNDTGSGNTIEVFRSLGGESTELDTVTSGRSALDAAKELVQISCGSFFQTAAGVITFRAYGVEDAYLPVATFNGTLTDMAPGTDLAQVANAYQVTLNDLDGNQVYSCLYIDDASEQEFGLRQGPAIASSWLLSNALCVDVAQRWANETKDPDGREGVWDTQAINDSDANQAAMLATDLLKLVTINDPTTGQTNNYVVQSMNGTIVPGGDYGGIYTLSMQLTNQTKRLHALGQHG